LSELYQQTKYSQPGNEKFPVREQNIPSKGITEQQSAKNQSYAEHKEQQKQLRKAEKAVEESERKISDMERRLKELDDLLMKPENASNMEFVTEYTTTKKALDEEVERWERLSEELENISN
jgi:ATP-binding cassette subfamily F protein 3